MKLWVDDIRNAPDETWNVARTATSAIKAIAQFQFDEISLDHDISHQVIMGDLERPYPCAETFQSVAYFIAEKYWITRKMIDEIGSSDFSPEVKDLMVSRLVVPPKITIHSSNIVGSKEMASVLNRVGISVEMKHMGLANRLEMEVK